MSIDPYLQQLEKNIQLLINQEKFSEAYELCRKSIQLNGKDRNLLSLQRLIEKEVSLRNQELLKKQYREIKQILSQKDYLEALKRLKILMNTNPNNKKIESLWRWTQSKYQRQTQKAEASYLYRTEKSLKQLYRENSPQLLSRVIELEQHNPGNLRVVQLTKRYRDQIIKRKIAQMQPLLKSDKLDDINHFLSDLEKIDSNSPDLLALKQKTKIRFRQENTRAKREYIYKGISYFEVLMKLKKFDKAIQAAKEILQNEPDNHEVRRKLAWAENAFFDQCRDQSIDNIRSTAKELQSKYLSEPEKFIKI